jgi:hypothetical protein
MQQTVMSDGTGKFVTEGWGAPSVYSVTTRHHLWNDASLTAVPVPSDDVRVVLQARPTLGVLLDSPANDRLLATAHLLHETRRSDDLAQDYPSYATEQSQPFGGAPFVQFRPQMVGALRLGVRTGDRWIISERMEWGPHSQTTTVTLSPQAGASLMVRISGDPADLAQGEWTLTNLAIPDGMGDNSFDPIGSPGQIVEFGSLPAGPYLLVGSSPSGGTAVISDLELAPGERRELAVSLAPSLRTVRGRVTDGAGSPVEASVATTRSDPSTGEFVLHAVPGGSRYLVLADNNGTRGMVSLSLNLDVDPPPVEIQLQRRVSVRINLPAVVLERVNRGERLALRGPDGELIPVAAGEGGPPLVNLPEGTYGVLLGSEETGLVRIVAGKESVDVEPVRR